MFEVYEVDDFSVVRSGGRDEWERPLAPTIEALKGYIEWETKVVVNLAGEEVLSIGNVTYSYDEMLTHNDKIMISDVKHPIVMIKTLGDFSPVTTKAYFQ